MTFVAVFSPNFRFPTKEVIITADFVDHDSNGFRFYTGEKGVKQTLVAVFEPGMCAYVYEIKCIQKKEGTNPDYKEHSSKDLIATS